MQAILAALLLMMLAPSPDAEAEGGSSAPGQAATGALTSMRVESTDPELEELARELQLRVPHVPLVKTEEDPGALHVWIRAQRLPTLARTYEVTVIVSDGRGYFRTVEVTDSDPARVVATSVANLLLAVEDGAVIPDREDAVIPPSDEPEAEQDEVSPAPAPAPAPAPEQPGRRGPAWGLSAGGELVLGLGVPRDAPALAAGGGSVGARVLGSRGGAGMVGLRLAGRSSGDLGIFRVRVALGGGYILARPRFELAVLGFGFVEPWTLTGDEPVRPRPRPLLGLGLRLAPGLAFEAGPLRGRVGPRAELSISGVPADGMAAVRVVRVGDDDPALRAGGLELGAGAELVLWWGASPQAGSTSSSGSPSSTSAPSSGRTRTTRAGSGSPAPP